MLDWSNNWQDNYRETGADPFNIEQKRQYSSLLRTEVGLRLYETCAFDSWDLTIQEKVGYVNVHSFHAGMVNAFLIGSGGSFTVETLAGSQNLGLIQLEAVFNPVNRYYPCSTILYQGEFGTQYQSHQMNLECSWSF